MTKSDYEQTQYTIDEVAHSWKFDNPLGSPDENDGLFGSPIWEKMNDRERGDLRRHQVAWQFSNFLHGEQGALMCASKIVNTVPTAGNWVRVHQRNVADPGCTTV